MAQSSDPVVRAAEAEIARTRARLAASLGALREDLAGFADWRAWIARRPLPFLAGAFVLGLWVGARAGARRAA